jgi:hypothetical protein
MFMEKIETKIKNPFTNRNKEEVWSELMSRPSKPADKNAILRELANKIKTKRQKLS